ncbi:MAG: lipase [Cyanobacteria bacterium RYN_339]|nr:lipase [Cyanobacteria bacterium RYN_339]
MTLVLLAGIHDTAARFDPILPLLGDRPVQAVDLAPADGTHSLANLAQQADAAIRAVEGPVDLVGYSLGGLVARYAIQRLGSPVARLVTIATPHQGTWIAHGLRNVAGREMRPNSPFLQDLERDWAETACKVPTLAIWTPFDGIVVPAWNARLAGAATIRIPVWRHGDMVTDPRVWAAVLAYLRGGTSQAGPGG